jgi:hypothetical protein
MDLSDTVAGPDRSRGTHIRGVWDEVRRAGGGPPLGSTHGRVSLERASAARSSHVVSRQQTACPASRRVRASSCWQVVLELSPAAKSFVVPGIASRRQLLSFVGGPALVGSWAECVTRTMGGSTAPQVGLGASNGALTRANCSGAERRVASGLTRMVLRQRKAESSMCRAPTTMRADANISPTVAGLSAAVDESSTGRALPTLATSETTPSRIVGIALQRVRPVSVVVNRQ